MDEQDIEAALHRMISTSEEDVKAARIRAANYIRFLENGVLEEVNQLPNLTEEQRKAFAMAGSLTTAFESLDQNFIARIAARNRALAVEGYKTLIFFAAIASVGSSVGIMSRQRLSFLAKQITAARGSGLKRQQEAIRTWQADALEFCRKYVANNPNYSQDNLATEIMIELAPARLVKGKWVSITHGHIKNVIRDWKNHRLLPVPKKTCEPGSADM